MTEKEINKFKDPDVQYALYEAEKGAARRDSEDLRENLSDLIIARIKNDDDDLKKLIYNEAISTINKITTNQLKILAIVLALRYLNFPFIRDWESFNIHFNMHIKPLLDFDESEINFTHLDYSSCASIIPQGKYILIDRLKNTYTFLFQNPIDNPEIKEMKNILIDKKIFPQIFKYNIKIKKYEFNCRNFDNLIKILGKNKIWRDIQNEIMGLYESIIKSDSEIRKEIEERTDLGEKILFRWDHSKINVINLKSVGVILGALYLEKISNVGMDINNLIYN